MRVSSSNVLPRRIRQTRQFARTRSWSVLEWCRTSCRSAREKRRECKRLLHPVDFRQESGYSRRMSLWRGLRARARAIFSSRQADADLRDEIAFHLHCETEKNIALGMSPAEARRVALVSLG